MNEIDNLQNELDRHLPPHAGHVSVPSSDAPNAELQPLLVVAERLAAAPQPRLSDTARARIEAQLRAASSAIAQPQPRTASIRRFNGLQAMRWAAACLAVVVLLSWGTVRASANSLPGEPLYPVKRLAENAQLAFSADDLDLHLTFAERRIT